MKYVLVFIVGILAIYSLVLFTSYKTAKQELTTLHKAKYLCDSQTTDCNNRIHSGTPKGVCKPGGTCT